MDHCFLSFSIDYFIGLLYFIDDVDNTLGHNCQWTDNIRTELFDILTRLGPQKMEVYIKQHLNGWKTEKVRFAVAGRSATGKSTFINKFRGIKEGQDGFADVGFGDETEKISEYRHPLNENIVFCDLPGLSMKFTKRKFLEMVNLSEYPYI
jgi:ribosome biogenesis GTPase A